MRISGYGAAGSSQAAASAPKQGAAQAVRTESKLDLKASDGFASSQLPAGVGENVNIKA
jgi:hypothetical protein